jgi:UDP-N-acetylmuramate: L-alanyl-gamma-D-glutamyl-meso-diaminopimelate ligase
VSEHVHLIGIGGTGMTSLAGLLQAAGARVTGSDRALYPPTSEIVRALGLPVSAFDAARLQPAPDLVVIGNAVSRGNPEVEAVLDRDLRYTSMPALVAERFLRGRHSIVVAGTHGKTTTASMLAWVLTHAGRAPGFFIGGQPCDLDLPFRLGTGPAFVIEGDEYDTAFFDKGPKFMHYRPRTAIVGTVEYDHADIYADLGQIKTAFRRFTNLVPASGLLVRHEECAATREVTEGAPCRVTGFGLAEGAWRASDVREEEQGVRFRLERDGRTLAEIRLRVSGTHNVLNALAVAAAASEQGLTPAEIEAGLGTFNGVRRRMESRGSADGVTVVDDFAHHPTAIAATLAAARRRYPRARLWALCEPRSWSLRRNVFQSGLAAALEPADEIVLAAVYEAERIPEGERLDVPALVAELVRRGRRARFVREAGEIAALVAAEARAGDVVVVMSNGSFGGIHGRLLGALSERASVTAPAPPARR